MAAFGPRGSAAAALAAARPRAEAAGAHSMVIYFVRHAEARHNVLEKAAVAEAVAAGATPRHADAARKAMLKRESQRDVIYDAPLSDKGVAQAAAAATNVRRAAQLRAAPELVLVSPLRRALRTAIEIFGGPEMRADGAPARGGFFSEGPSEGAAPARPPPLSITTSRTSAEGARFVAVEALREKRTGLACDERSSAAELTAQYPSVCFSDVFAANAENDEHRCFGWSGGVPPPTPHTAARDAADAFLPAFVVREGEDNAAVRARAMAFVSTLPAPVGCTSPAQAP